ncbi:N-Acetylneuraminate cytidylyltransferase [Paramagnetospirillum magnetotacticum MS-1]|uniref:N-Acetylneuraminate cytidylyltransferase n=1 Tax=Paramagnetospirillum magnetotacticum MS-1 TaxID=272627 RepID=A0A0C2YWV4_PARME|nr:UDP-2,4-diacetamido-2,4,6-trideoxy-beta-L-altropyranose hydrolase [Paramagnetospirillum magnetotacticum]KIL99155.1 N-Acetylneuraminate cytidylyltransferase [Paramagnetospirillum magnetotacticum MS-1]
MVTPTICFRADASAAMGTGHVMRCLTLADELARRGGRCLFVSTPETAEMVPSLPYEVVTPEQLPFGSALVVIDHYGIGAGEEARIRSMSRAVMVIDDLPTRRHHSDLLLDQTFGRRPEEYRDLVPHNSVVLAGSDYALLRPQFAAARSKSLARRDGSLRRLLVSLGGTDPDNITGRVLDAVAGSGLAVDVVMGAKAPHLDAVKAQAAAMAEVTVHVGVSDMAGLMVGADLAIGAAGTSTWERCCLGLPTLMLVIAENQRDVARLVGLSGAARLITVDDLPAALTVPSTELRALSAAAAKICDGLGAARTVDAIRRLPFLKGLAP